MRFLVVTNAPTLKRDNLFCAYAPYVREMDMWFKYVKTPIVLSPTVYEQKLLLSAFKKQPTVISVPVLIFTSFSEIFRSAFNVPYILAVLFKEMRKADHIHLRCPGNMGLLGCLVQIFFPKTPKTAKYAGNWDPESKQPLSYRFQKWLLNNTTLTKNIQVLVYGDWDSKSPNIKPFFTASFLEAEKSIPKIRDYNTGLQFLFVGSLVEGKRPLYAIKLVERLHKLGYKVQLDFFGEGVLRVSLQNYIEEQGLEEIVKLHGNQELNVVKGKLELAHFLILPSKSEGWPKAVAEAMFCGTIPIATPVSCVPYMLDYGKRGLLISGALEPDVKQITEAL
ncbi:MAG: glycosyltransferase, partial [Bizionia sp.]|nr:glycosyltransferase [Bizionia sp.]